MYRYCREKIHVHHMWELKGQLHSLVLVKEKNPSTFASHGKKNWLAFVIESFEIAWLWSSTLQIFEYSSVENLKLKFCHI